MSGTLPKDADWRAQNFNEIAADENENMWPYWPRNSSVCHTCVRLARERDLEVLVLDQTRADVGIPVVKVIVPGMRHFWARFGPGRLYDVPAAMGWLESEGAVYSGLYAGARSTPATARKPRK